MSASEGTSGRRGAKITRRSALGAAALLGLGAGVDHALGGPSESASAAQDDSTALPFDGPHQGGIATPVQDHLSFASFDVLSDSPRRLREMLIEWTAAARALTAGREYLGPSYDPGEALGLAPSRLTLTFGFGPSLFERMGRAMRRPALLEPLPAFAGERLNAGASGGDVCVQACADDPQVTFHAVHALARVAGAAARLRWVQLGFNSPVSRTSRQTPRNLLGFKDGTDNIRTDDRRAMDRFVWADSPSWFRGGTYLVVRRIQIVFSGWDYLSLAEQERTIGRRKVSGAPLGGVHESDRVDFDATDDHGRPVIPPHAHIRVASDELNGGQRILRRGYSYSNGATFGRPDNGGHEVDGGLFFIGFVRDPQRQFIPIQRRLSTSDALNAFTVHTASAIFACPPGVRPGGFAGQSLFV